METASTSDSKEQCDLCQEYGSHSTKDCPSIICIACGQKGHTQKNCPRLVNPEQLQNVSEMDFLNFEFEDKPGSLHRYVLPKNGQKS